MKKYQQLTLRQRYQIWTGLRLGLRQKEIAMEVGVHRSSISRELKRNMSEDRYRPQVAMHKAYERRAQKGKRRIPERTWTQIEDDIRQSWSPEQISGRRRSNGQYPVSHEWIYQHIYRDKDGGGDLHTYLRCRKKQRKRYGSYAKRGFRDTQISIDERPPIVAEKSRIGDLEVDTIIGNGNHQAIVTIVDRKSKLLRMKKVKQKTGTLVREAICDKLKGLTVHTLTSDNGCEFSEHKKIAKTLGAAFYFCHPYSSWERGLNENTNGLIRQFFPKHMKFATITESQVKQVEDRLNNRPRKSLAYQTPNEVYFNQQEHLRKVALTT
jgi:IS30 family transposase